MALPSSAYSDLSHYIGALENEFGFHIRGDSGRGTALHRSNSSDEASCFRCLQYLWFKDFKAHTLYLDDAVHWLRDRIPPDRRHNSLQPFIFILREKRSEAFREYGSSPPNKSISSRSAHNSFQDSRSNSLLPCDESRNTSFATDTNTSAMGSNSTEATSFSTTSGPSFYKPDFNAVNESLKWTQNPNQLPPLTDPFREPIVPFKHSPTKPLTYREPRTDEWNGGDTEPATPASSVQSTPQKRESGDDISPSAKKAQVGLNGGLSLEPFQVRLLRTEGFFVDDLPPKWANASWRVRYECTRLGQLYGIDWQNASLDPSPTFEQYSVLVEALKSQASQDVANLRERNVEFCSSGAWDAAGGNNSDAVSPNLMLTGKLKYCESHSKPVYSLSLSPLRLDSRMHRFARKFGAHRILRLSIPPFRDRPSYIKEKNLRNAFAEWLNGPDKRIIGCSWTALYLKSGSSGKKAFKIRNPSDVTEFEAFFFATEGPGLESISIRQVIDWYMPLELNASYAVMKLYSRLELGFSRTLPSVTFKPSQVEEKEDLTANGDEEDQALQDPSFDWQDQYDAKTVMNDGCSQISAAAAKLAWEKIGKFGPVPSAFQGRIGSAKGMWIVQRETIQNEGEFWIELRKSQIKFCRHKEDKDDTANYEPLRLTLEITNWPEKPVPSTLYREFLPILEDRGVPRAALIEYVALYIESYTGQWQSAVDSGVGLRRWLQESWAFMTDQEGVEVAPWDGPRRISKTIADKAKSLLEAGFEPRNLKYLAFLISRIASWKLAFISNELKIEIPKSTFVYGVADPIGCLGPNEIYLDPEITDRAQFLEDVDALVARHPALRRSDIQRVKIVFKPELIHLRHITVFPVNGKFPLAGKLQGGDYDGDRFWVCWEPKLVKPFRNAPAPTKQPQPESLGIAVNTTICRDMWALDGTLRKFLGQAFDFQMQSQYLGICTNFLEKFRYCTGQMHGLDFDRIVDLHDLIIDGPKNGYIFTAQAWTDFVGSLGVPSRQLVDPAYKTLKSQDLFSSTTRKTKREDIIDYLIFHVAREKSREFVQKLEERLQTKASNWDQCLAKPLLLVQEEYRLDCQIQSVLSRLTMKDVEEVAQPWLDAGRVRARDLARGLDDKEAVFAAARERCSERFKALKPRLEDFGNVDPQDPRYAIRSDPCNNPTVKAWLQRTTDHGLSSWDAIKTAALYKTFHEKPDIVFHVAGYNLCRIKAESLTTSVHKPEVCTTMIFSHLKMRKRKFDEITIDPGHFVEEDVTVAGKAEPVSEDEDEEEFHDAEDGMNGVSQQFVHSSLEETAGVSFAR